MVNDILIVLTLVSANIYNISANYSSKIEKSLFLQLNLLLIDHFSVSTFYSSSKTKICFMTFFAI